MKLELMELRNRVQDLGRDNERLKHELAASELLRKRSATGIRSLRENRGKVLRGLSTQTEIATAQFKQDFEYLRRQIESKDEVIQLQEKKMKSLIESNCMLQNGLEQQGGPLGGGGGPLGGGGLESEDDERIHSSLILNGHGHVTPVQVELARFVKQLDL